MSRAAHLFTSFEEKGFDISVTGGGVTSSADLTVTPADAPRLTSFSVSPTSVEVKAGDYVIRGDQPYRTLADMYFSVQDFSPANPRPYDDTGWTLDELTTGFSALLQPIALLDPETPLLAIAILGGCGGPRRLGERAPPRGGAPHGRHYYWKSHRLTEISESAIAVMCENLARITSPMSSVPIFNFGGAVGRVPEDATPFPHRNAACDINIVASWLPEQAGDADRHVPLHDLPAHGGEGRLRMLAPIREFGLRRLHDQVLLVVPDRLIRREVEQRHPLAGRRVAGDGPRTGALP